MDALEQQPNEMTDALDAASAPRGERLLSLLSFSLFVVAVSIAYSTLLGAGVVIGVMIARVYYRR